MSTLCVSAWQIPIWAEGRIAAERLALARDPVLRGEGVPRGDGGPVLLVPGFLAGDASLTPGGSHVGMAVNARCSARSARRSRPRG